VQSSEITQPALPGGYCNPDTSRIGTTKCPVSCIKEWTDTTTCYKPTGYLEQSSVITQPALNGGTECDPDTSRIGTTTCPVDCLKGWVNTTECVNGYFLIEYRLIKPAQNGGACPPTIWDDEKVMGITPCPSSYVTPL
jgi:hypothetical protein